jgi:hypothetical protein
VKGLHRLADALSDVKVNNQAILNCSTGSR